MSRPVAVILAAGEGRRMGKYKALARVGGKTFLEHIAATLRAVRCSGVVVSAPDRPDVASLATASDLELSVNPRPEQGPYSSLRVGIGVASRSSAVLVWPVDVPLVSADALEVLLQESTNKILIPTYRGRGGHPVLVPAVHRQVLLGYSGEGGLRRLLQERAELVRRVETPDETIHWGANTPQELEHLEQMVRGY